MLAMLPLTSAIASSARHWRVLNVKVPSAGGGGNWGFSGVSCQSAQSCVAVGAYSVVDGEQYDWPGFGVWNGATWSIHAFVPAGSGDSFGGSVSCAPAARCVAVHSYPDTAGLSPAVWGGKTWSYPPAPWAGVNSGYPASGVSCPSVNDCEVVGQDASGNVAASWNGSSWSLAAMPTPPGVDLGPFGPSLGPVSCSSASACTAVGSIVLDDPGGGVYAERWDGQSWTLQTLPVPVGASFVDVAGISCPSSDDCTTVGWWGDFSSGIEVDRPYVAEWSEGIWTMQTFPIPASLSGAQPQYGAYLGGVSCTADNSCLAVGRFDAPGPPIAEVWDGTSWSWEPTAPGVSGGFSSVSCISGAVCTAVGSLAETTGPAPQPSGHAALHRTPTSCIEHRFAPLVRGKKIATVRWSLDGRPLRGQTLRPSRSYSTRIKLTPGRHVLIATVTFKASAFTPTATLRRRVTGCRAP